MSFGCEGATGTATSSEFQTSISQPSISRENHGKLHQTSTKPVLNSSLIESQEKCLLIPENGNFQNWMIL